MMIERMALIDRAQPFDIDGAMHDESMYRPFEDVCEQEGQRDRQPFQPCDVVDVCNINIKRRRTDRVDDQDMDVTVVPADDARAIFPTERFLPIRDHVVLLYLYTCACSVAAPLGVQCLSAMARSTSAPVKSSRYPDRRSPFS